MNLRKQTIDDVVLRDKRVIIGPTSTFRWTIRTNHRRHPHSLDPATINRAVDDGAR
jgi:hypothetical protein